MLTSGDRQGLPPEGGFCSRLRRRHHSRGHHRRQCSRGGTIVPRDGLPSHKLVDSHYSSIDGVQRSFVTRRVLRCGHRGVRVGEASHPGPPRRLRRCRERSQDARHVVLRVTGSEDDEPLVQSCVQETALDSVRMDLTVIDTDEEAVAHEEDDAV